jgi:hypothetical protein
MANSDFIIKEGKIVAYVGSSNAEVIDIPEGVTSIGSYIFQEKMNKELIVNLSSTVKQIEDHAFCLKNGAINEYDTFVPDKSARCLLKELNIPKNSQLEEIGDYAFFGYTKKMFIPKSLKKFGIVGKSDISDISVVFDGEICYFDIQEFEFEPQSQLNKVYKFHEKPIVKLPRNLHEVEILSANYILIIPKELKSFQKISSIYVFFEGKIPNEWHLKIDAAYVLENVDYDHLIFVDQLKTLGVAYIETSKGLIVTKIDNSIAKFEDIPTEIEGKKIWTINVIDPFNPNDESEKENLGILFPKLKYYANENRDNMLSFIEKTVSNIKEKDYKKFDGQYGIFTSKEESIPPTSEAKGKVTAFTVGLGLMIIGFIPALIIAIIVGLLIKKSIILLFLILMFIIFVAGCLLYLFTNLFIKNKKTKSQIDPSKIQNTDVKYSSLVEMTYVFLETNCFNECYLHMLLIELNKAVKDKIEEARRLAKANAELQRSLQSLHETTMAYIKAKNAKSNQERALEQLEELNKNIKNSNSNSSYDVYDNEGNYLGRMDKR